MMRKRALMLLFLALVGACHRHRFSVPDGFTREEYIDACLHRPGARMRIYGCPPEVTHHLPQPLFVVDGRALPRSNRWWSRRSRERQLAHVAQTLLTIEAHAPGTAIAQRYGKAGAQGVVIIRTKAAYP